MKNDNGLYFEGDINNEKMIASIKETEKQVKGFTNTVVREGEKIDDAFKITAENIRIQKDVIAQLESNLNNLNIEISKLKPGTAQTQLKQEAAQVAAELKAEKDALKQLEAAVETNETAFKSYRSQIRAAKEELIRMEQAGLRGTPAYQTLQAHLGELTDAMSDAQAQASVLANDERGFQGVVSAVSGVTGAMSAAQGAVGLFAGENENLNKIMLKVQSMMAITIGLQQVAEMLNKDSYFSIVILTKAKEMLAIAEMKVATALGVSTVAARALMATLTLGLSIAITAIIVGLSKLQSKQAEAKKKQEEFNKAVADSAYKPIAALNELSAGWNALGKNIKAKEKFIEDNASKFDELGISINGVNEAEKLFTDPGTLQKFTQALMFRAKALAATELAAEKYKESIQKQMEGDAVKDKTITVQTGGYMGMGATITTKENPALTKIRKQQAALDLEAANLMKLKTEFTAQEKELLKQIGVSTTNVVDGSINAIEDSLSRLRDKYKKAANDTERANLLKQIRKQEALLDKVDQSDSKSSGSSDPFKDRLEKRKAQYQQYYKWMNSGDASVQQAAKTEFDGLLKQGKSFLEYLKTQRDGILSVGAKTEVQKAQLKTLNDMIADETKKTVLQDFQDALSSQMDQADSVLAKLAIIDQKRKELKGDGTDLDNGKKSSLDDAEKSTKAEAEKQGEKLLEEYASYLTRKKKLQADFNNDMVLLQQKLSKATTDEEKKAIQAAIENRRNQYESDNKSSGDDAYDQLLAQYQTFEQKKQTIIDEFDAKRKKAQEMGNTEMVKQLNEAEAKALSELSLEEIQSSGLFKNLFANLDNLTVQSMIDMRNKLEAEWAKLDLDPEKLAAIREQLDQVTAKIQEKNPFAALGDALKRLKEQREAQDINKWMANPKNAGKGVADFGKAYAASTGGGEAAAIADVAASAGAIGSMIKSTFDQVTQSLDKMGIATDKQTNEVLNDVSGMIGGATNLAMGIASGNPLQIIQGSIDLISNGIDLIAGAKDRKLERQIQKHAKQVEKLRDTYKDLEKAVDKALGMDVYGAQKAEVSNLMKQQKEYQAMLEAEQKKRKSKRDEAKIKEYQDNIKESKAQMAEIVQQMKEQLLASDVKSIAKDLGGAIIDAFAGGENAAEAWGEKVNDVVGNVIKNLIIQSAVEKPVGNIINSYMSKWVDSNGNLLMSTDQIMASAAQMGSKLKDLGPAVQSILDSLPEDIKKYITGSGKESSALSGAMKAASEESVSMLSGYANAIRINQMEAMNIMRAKLIALNQIATNTSFNINLTKLNDILDVLNRMATSDSLRASGL